MGRGKCEAGWDAWILPAQAGAAMADGIAGAVRAPVGFEIGVVVVGHVFRAADVGGAGEAGAGIALKAGGAFVGIGQRRARRRQFVVTVGGEAQVLVVAHMAAGEVVDLIVTVVVESVADFGHGRERDADFLAIDAGGVADHATVGFLLNCGFAASKIDVAGSDSFPVDVVNDAVAVVVESVAGFGSGSGARAGVTGQASAAVANGLAELFADSEFAVGAGLAFADARHVAAASGAGFADVGSVMAGPASHRAFTGIGIVDIASGVKRLRAQAGDLGIDDARGAILYHAAVVVVEFDEFSLGLGGPGPAFGRFGRAFVIDAADATVQGDVDAVIVFAPCVGGRDFTAAQDGEGIGAGNRAGNAGQRGGESGGVIGLIAAGAFVAELGVVRGVCTDVAVGAGAGSAGGGQDVVKVRVCAGAQTDHIQGGNIAMQTGLGHGVLGVVGIAVGDQNAGGGAIAGIDVDFFSKAQAPAFQVAFGVDDAVLVVFGNDAIADSERPGALHVLSVESDDVSLCPGAHAFGRFCCGQQTNPGAGIVTQFDIIIIQTAGMIDGEVDGELVESLGLIDGDGGLHPVARIDCGVGVTG